VRRPQWVEVVTRNADGEHTGSGDFDYNDIAARRAIAEMVAVALARGGSVTTRALRADEVFQQQETKP